MSLGWAPPAQRSGFDRLPVVMQATGEAPVWREIPSELVLEVQITHPEHAWFAELGLTWYALPARLEHAAGRRRAGLTRHPVQRLAPGHRDRHPQLRRHLPRRPDAAAGPALGPGQVDRPHALARPGAGRARRRGAAFLRAGRRVDEGSPRHPARLRRVRGLRTGRGTPRARHVELAGAADLGLVGGSLSPRRRRVDRGDQAQRPRPDRSVEAGAGTPRGTTRRRAEIRRSSGRRPAGVRPVDPPARAAAWAGPEPARSPGVVDAGQIWLPTQPITGISLRAQPYKPSMPFRAYRP